MRKFEDYREFVEDQEAKLADFAMKSLTATYLDGTPVEERYRQIFSENDIFNMKRNAYRTPFQYDRDRILHSNYFLRLAQKTQLITSGETGIVEDRLKHTLRVCQIARSIARGLKLNEDLVEVIAFGHDVGHTPFGHVGEYALNDWIEGKMGSFDVSPYQRTLDDSSIEPLLKKVPEKFRESFKEFFTFGYDKNDKFFMHGRNSFRCLVFKKKVRREYTNFTREALFGIWRHSTKSIETDGDFKFKKELENGKTAEMSGKNTTLETQVVRYADDIAWIVTDLIEGMRIGIISYIDIVDRIETEYQIELDSEMKGVLFELQRENIGPIYTYFISDIIETNKNRLSKRNDKLELSENVEKAFFAFKELINERMLSPTSSLVRGDKVKYAQLIALCDWYFEHYKQLLYDLERMQKRPAFPYTEKWDEKLIKKDEIARIALITDFMSTLTDAEAEELSRHLPVQ